MESLEELHHWVAEEAEYQVQASEFKHGLSSVGNARAKPSLISGSQKRNVIVPVRYASKNTQFGNVMCSKEWTIERIGRWQRNLDCVTIAWRKGTFVTHVLGAESVELTDARTNTTCYFTTRK